MSKTSEKFNVDIRMRYHGKSNIAFCYLDARIESKTLDLQSKLERIKVNIRALKELVEEIGKYESQHSKGRKV